MVTNGEIIYQFKEMTDKHHISSNTGWSDSWILWYLLRNRAYLIKQKDNISKRTSRFNQMTTPCLKLVKAKSCPCVPPIGCEALMTELLIPQSITGILSVSNPDGSIEYTEVESTKFKYRSRQRFKVFRDSTVWFSMDEGSGTRIYLFSQKNLKNIVVTLIPENPIDIQRMPDCEGTLDKDCVSNYDLEWKLDADLTKTALDMALDKLKQKYVYTDIKANNIDDNAGNKSEIIGTNS